MCSLQREYWMGRRETTTQLPSEDYLTLVPENKRLYFETPLQNDKAGIQMRGLTKV